ncbi:MAG: AAA family ATPase [Anaerolineae bacterium]|nr:AAA family ATPase [Anaerolineae bacterium]
MDWRPGKRGKKQVQYDDDLFSFGQAATTGGKRSRKPLADRMRPASFDEFVGQEHIVGSEHLLRRAIEADQLTSIILWGPPGTGKTTIAYIIAHETHSEFATLNAVLDGVKELRDVIVAAESRPRNVKTILFVDEIHRWNRAQQDALLPHVEAGTITLIGATTENPYYSLVGPLLSRSRVFRLEPLRDEDVLTVLRRAISDPQRGYGEMNLQVSDDALEHWVSVAGGDARSALNALELAVTSTHPDSEERIVIDLNTAAESIQKRVVRYDKDQDEHYDTVSAFIKSLRGSDPDAALYWMAKMLVAGEDPLFIFRRMTILACEDVGLADPQALVVVNAAAQAFERIGMPEGNYLLAQACLYLATAPKSNTANAIFSAIAHIEQNGSKPVPPHLRDSTASAIRARHEGTANVAAGYKYPHDFPGAWVDQPYLPEGMDRPNWYKPKSLGYEQQIAARFRPGDDEPVQAEQAASQPEAIIDPSEPVYVPDEEAVRPPAAPVRKPAPPKPTRPATRPVPKPGAKKK